MYYKIAMNIDISENYREHLNKVHDKIKSWNKEDLEIMRKYVIFQKRSNSY